MASGFHSGSLRDFTLVESSEVPWSDRYNVYDIVQYYRDRCRLLWVFAEDFKPDPGAIAALANRHVLASEVLGMIDLACKHMGVLFFRQERWAKSTVQVLPQHTRAVGKSSQHRIDSYCHLRYRIIEEVQREKRRLG